MAKTVFVLGAGASKAGGAPLMGEFLDRARDLWARGDVPDDAASFEKVFKIIGALQIANSKSRLDLANIEALFNTFEMARLLGVFPLPGLTTTAEQAIDALRTVVAATLEATTNFQFAEGGLIPPSPYPDFVKLLVHLSGKAVPPHTVAVLTFNYDLGLDYALSRAGVSTDYCLGFAGPSTVPLLKLHGSLNWAVTDDTAERVLPWEMRDFTNRLSSQLVGRGVGPVKLSPRRSFAMFPDQPGPFKSGPFIVPPTWNKSDHHHAIKPVWERAATELRDAENVFVIGYSLPETDGFFKMLYALGTIGPSPLSRFWLFDPEPSGEVANRFRAMLRPAAEARFRPYPITFDHAIQTIRAEFPDR